MRRGRKKIPKRKKYANPLGPTGQALAKRLNKECIRQGALIPQIFEAAARIAAAYCIHWGRRAIDRERLPPTNKAAGDEAIRISERFTEMVQEYIQGAVQHGEDPLG